MQLVAKVAEDAGLMVEATSLKSPQGLVVYKAYRMRRTLVFSSSESEGV